MEGKNLIELMVQETFSNLEETSNVASIFDYTEAKIKAFHDKSRKCLILYSEDKLLEIPQNFQALNELQSSKLLFKSDSNNNDFYEILKNYFKIQSNSFSINIENLNDSSTSKNAA